MRLTPEQAAEVRASKGLYRAADVARHYGVHRSTVKRIWDGELHKDAGVASEPPNVITRPRPSDLYEDILILVRRGLTYEEVANTLGVSKSSVWAIAEGVWV